MNSSPPWVSETIGFVSNYFEPSTPREIPIAQFDVHCLPLLDEVSETGETLVITKCGRPIARVEPLQHSDDLRGSAKINMSDEELIYFSMGPWDMEKDE
jgi:prevent-host-death family protein